MKIAAVALILGLTAAVVLWFGDNLYNWGPGSLFSNQASLLILLLSIPISLSLFFLLSLRKREEDAPRRGKEASPQLSMSVDDPDM